MRFCSRAHKNDDAGEPEIVLTPADGVPTGAEASAPAESEPNATSPSIRLFGVRSQAKSLASELGRLRERVDRLGLMDVIQLEERKAALGSEVAALQARLETERSEAVARIEKEQEEVRKRAESSILALADKELQLEARVAKLQEDVVVTEEASILQEVGIYEYRHPLSDAVAYQAALRRLQDRIKVMARKDGGAVLADTNWTVNNSKVQGRKMVREYSKLVLRAYNAEADNLVRGLRPFKLESALERLDKIALTIAKLGSTMHIHISAEYHALRVQELELTADYLEKRAEEKEREAAERDRLREERKVQQELARERARLEKEHEHYSNVIRRLVEQGKLEAADQHRGTLADIEKAIQDVDYRVANVRAGYVYVISNIGAFGEKMVKIGLTRRIDPTERVRELGDASVPFRYDTHALFFSDDAVGLEAKMHERLADRRVNWVNKRREFFYVTPAEAKTHLLDLAGELLEYVDAPEALEFRQSQNQRALQSLPSDPAPDDQREDSGAVPPALSRATGGSPSPTSGD